MKFISSINPLFLLLGAAVAGLISINALRQNAFTTNRLREAVTVADQQNGDVEKALQDLRRHVYGHMNTNLTTGANPIKPPIQLKYRYERLVAAEQERVKVQNQQVAARAESVCGQQFPAGGFNAPRVACIQDYMSANAVKAGGVADDLYKFDFVSPRWSPDLAGWSMVVATLLGVAFVLKIAVSRLLR